MMFRSCETDFNLDRHLIPFLQEVTFFAEISRRIRKVFTKDLPTAAVTYDMKSNEMVLYVNPDFFATLSNAEIRGVLTHEFYHLVFGHLAARRRNPPKMWNVATDLAINSLIVKNAEHHMKQDATTDGRAIPKFCLLPGQWPSHPDGREMSAEEKQGAKVAALIASFPELQSSEWYFYKLQEAANDAQKNGDAGDFGGLSEDWIDSWDDHTPWDEIPDEMREYVEGKVKAIVEKAVREADKTSTGWGSIPAELREEIRRSVSHVINWRNVLRQFIGTLFRGGRTTSIKRINRRYPYIHPGIKRGYAAKLLIARDESGSVYDAMLEEFFGELSSLTKKVEIDLLPFDCSANVKDVVRWTKGTVPAKAAERTKCGGTDFSAPTEVFNDPKNRGRWDGLLIMTDGQAPAPSPCRGRRGWVLGQGCNLIFESNELQVFLTKETPMVGAWR